MTVDLKSGSLYALLKRRGFIYPSFDIYGGVSGFYDYGPRGAALLHRLQEEWRKFFVVQEGFYEVETAEITPEEVFRASGHLDRFNDYLTRCTSCGASYRADNLIEELTGKEVRVEPAALNSELKKIRCPRCGGELADVEEFNLMFSTAVGPGGGKKSYLRPETAQGIFVNFPHLLREARGKLPFGVAQIGRGFRNEISPRQGLIRMREFHMAEGEFFYNPSAGRYPPFNGVQGEVLRLLPAGGEEAVLRTGEAVERGIIRSEYLAYFMVISKRFLEHIGLDGGRIRFRQHRKDEMAHYARDCWDGEVLTSLGWIEVVGIADRSAYDLSRHQDASGAKMEVLIPYDEPRRVRVRRLRPRMDVLGPLFRGKAKAVSQAMEALEVPEDFSGGDVILEVSGERLKVPEEAYEIQEVEEVVTGERIIPNVIEPSFGLDRIFAALLEHSVDVKEKEGEEYRVMHLPPWVAPLPVAVFPLLTRGGMVDIALQIARELREGGIEVFYDEAGSIGRRYARADEIGIPLAVTVDHRTAEDGTVTLRERDSTSQVRLPMKELEGVVGGYTRGCINWKDIKKRYPPQGE